MINKQNLWFITLFSLILVLGIYYVTIGDENLITQTIENNTEPVVNITESDSLMALRIADDETTLAEIENYESILLDASANSQEKNDAYDALQTINQNNSMKEKLEVLIKENFSLDAYVKIKNDQINVTLAGNTHDNVLANNIINLIQKQYDKQMYITIKFQG